MIKICFESEGAMLVFFWYCLRCSYGSPAARKYRVDGEQGDQKEFYGRAGVFFV